MIKIQNNVAMADGAGAVDASADSITKDASANTAANDVDASKGAGDSGPDLLESCIEAAIAV